MTESKLASGNHSGSEEILQLVSFTIGEEEFGVNILQVQEINRMVDVTRVPNTPSYVDGIINLRGKVIPIIDLRCRFSMERKTKDKNSRIIVVELSSKIFGFVVDSVSEVLRIPLSVIEPPPSIIAGISREFITSIVKLDDRLLILLDLERILSMDELSSIKKIAA